MGDERIKAHEEMVGAGHETKPDTLNRLTLVEHNNDGTHKAMPNRIAADIASATGKETPDNTDVIVLTIPGATPELRQSTWAQIVTALNTLLGLAGKADLGADGKVPANQLPSYVDDVLEYDNAAAFPATGETGKIYVAKDTNLTYRWSGSGYAEISASLALGETSATAYRGDRGKTAYDHSQAAHAPSNAQKNSDILKTEIEAVLTGNITSHTHDLGSTDGNAIHKNVAAEIDALTGKDTPVDADVFIAEDSATTPTAYGKKKILWQHIKATLKTYFDTLYNLYTLPTASDSVLGGIKVGSRLSINSGVLSADLQGKPWQLISADNYTATPASTSTITMLADMTATIKVGMSLRYTWNGVEYFGQVAAITSNLLTVRGAPLSVSYAVSNLQFGGGIVTELCLPINGLYEDADNTALLASDNKSPLLWLKETSYAVHYRVWSRLKDTGATAGKASVRINNAELNTSADGLSISADATWYSTVVDINTSNYDIQQGEAIEVTAKKGTNGTAQDLCVLLLIITP